MSEFRDASGRASPAGWELAEYPQGRGDHPVGGVSWYEAAAYAEFRGKQLPTLYHWSTASLTGALTLLSSSMVEASNFLNKGPAKVGERPDIGPFGTYDMLGNVREWCWNAAKDDRWILGGAWSDDAFMFSMPYSLSPFDRSAQNGFRLVKYLDGPPQAALMQPRDTYYRDYVGAKPISDEVFEAYKRQYTPIRSDLNGKVEARDDKPDSWIKERVTVETGYLGERIPIYLYLPKRATPPYQAAIFFPNYGAFIFTRPGETPEPAFFDFIVKSGRALILPVFKGTYERLDPRERSLEVGSDQFNRFKREQMIQWRQDLARTIDYLQTRPEIDSEKIAYVGESFGGMAALPLLYLENRLKVAALMSGGMPTTALPPEIDPINFVPRTKIPLLLVSSRHDSLLPVETAQKPLMAFLGTDAANKRHVFLDGGHTQLPRGQTIKEILGWLDQYLGAVK